MKFFGKCALIALILTAQAGATYCVPRPAQDLVQLDRVVNVTSTEVMSPSWTDKETQAYSAGLLRGRVSETISSLLGNSSYSEAYSYTTAGKPSTVNITMNTVRSGTKTSQEVYEYDAQGRLTRVLGTDGPRRPLETIATCSYASLSITERETAYYGFVPRTHEYTLNAQGQVIRHVQTTERYKNDTDVTTFTYQNGRLVRQERREVNSIYPIKVTTTDYNSAGFPVKVVDARFEKNNQRRSQTTTTFDYVMDAAGNWVERREYEHDGDRKELAATTTRVIVYTKP
ncbi:hypothetical protein [Deinococcus arcticus]|uniref:Sugar-binding protein n=1 Tax=Deinococcus arcticus TaxID=2136176 RepID=A0A2T3W8W5_9DEIO|nr:hypothetical protein [Deinococcus arcticus]PTA68234.1 hypothetical protein C8263_09275 [Deinococcus arcticus]